MILSNRQTIYIKQYYNLSAYPYIWELDRIIQCEVLNDSKSNADFGLSSNKFLDLEEYHVIWFDKGTNKVIEDNTDYSRDAIKYVISDSVPKKNKIILYVSCRLDMRILNNFKSKYMKHNERMLKYEV
jgi:hypothetical protein